MGVYAEAKSWMAEEGGGIDLAAILREFPQFGRSAGNLARVVEEIGPRTSSDQAEATHPGELIHSSCGSKTRRAEDCDCSNCRTETQSACKTRRFPVEESRCCARFNDTGSGTLGAVLASSAREWVIQTSFPNSHSDWPDHGRNIAQTPMVREKKCGGDVTDLMVKTLNEAIKRMRARMRLAAGPGAIRHHLQLVREFRDRLLDDLNWKDPKKTPKGADCNKGCPNTLTVCGKCLDSSVPGNIMAGFLMKALGGTSAAVRRTAEQAARAPWPEHDRRAVDLGITTLDGLSSAPVDGDGDPVLTKDGLCKGVSAANLQPPTESDCANAPAC